MISKNTPHIRTGNALLISLLLMSILILITTGLARLVTSETRQIASMMRNGQAEYLAEGGTELGQLIFYNIEPGNEATFDGKYEFEIPNESDPKEIEFHLTGTTNHIPVRSRDVFENATNDQTKSLLFQPLFPGQSVEIPIKDNIEEFEVEYYIETIDVDGLGQFQQRDLDVLLFRLSGVKEQRGEFDVNFITQYFPAGAPFGATGDTLNIGAKANTPASVCTKTGTNCFNGGSYFEFSAEDQDAQTPEFSILDETAEDQLLNIDFSPQEEVQDEEEFNIFLRNHSNNIITMTNAINLAQIRSVDPSIAPERFEQLQEALGAIYFRVCSPNCEAATISNSTTPRQPLTSPFVTIESIGQYRGTQKILFTELSRPTALSVFDFAIFQTGGTSD
jgi:hypothetical protein